MLYGVSVIDRSKFHESGTSSYYGFSHSYNISDCSEEDNEEAVTGSSGSSTVDDHNATAAPIYLQCLSRN